MKTFSAILLIAALASCSDGPSDQSASEEKLGMARGGVMTVQAQSADMASEAAPLAAPTPPPRTALAVQDVIRTPMLVRTAQARVEVDSLETAVAAVQAMTTRMGGYVVGVATQTGAEQVREATITARIPAPRFDEALSSLEPLGTVESVNVTSEDVGEEFVDVNVRLENGRRLERRLLQLLDTRTGKLEEVLAVERELARVREDIERLEGRMRFLRNRADLGTVTITVHEPMPLLSNYSGQNILLQSIKQAWRNFVGLVAGVIASLGILLPVAAVVAAVWFGVNRRRTSRADT